MTLVQERQLVKKKIKKSSSQTENQKQTIGTYVGSRMVLHETTITCIFAFPIAWPKFHLSINSTTPNQSAGHT